jgi:hypothetical protein
LLHIFPEKGIPYSESIEKMKFCRNIFVISNAEQRIVSVIKEMPGDNLSYFKRCINMRLKLAHLNAHSLGF